jgi:MoaA/NifB/PqqE/SkfB family radical SAM enzyme
MATLGSNFCLAPFTQLTFGPAGNYSPCPEIGGRPWTDPSASPLLMWTSNEFNELRNSFKSNERNSICNRCWDQEADGKQSLRRRLFTQRKMFETGESSKFLESGYLQGPKQINIITSNNCNLRCRICRASSSWTYNVEGRVYEGKLKQKTIYTSDTKKPVHLSPEQLDEIYRLSNNLQRLEFYGGEPLLDDKTIILLKRYVTDGSSKNITLMYNTNGTNLPTEDHFELWKHFKTVEFNFSIDDIGDRFTYNRHPGKWSDILHTIDSIKSHPGNFNLFSICTVSTLNVYYLPEILDEIDRLGLTCFINHVFGPAYYDIKYLPTAIKTAVKEKLVTYRDPARIKYIMNMLDHPENLSIWEQFKTWTDLKDEHRKESFAKTFPEFNKVIEAYDNV